MGACTRRIAPASGGTKATSLGTARVDRAAWCMPSPQAPDVGINHLTDDDRPDLVGREVVVEAPPPGALEPERPGRAGHDGAARVEPRVARVDRVRIRDRK